jgi:hypothetical protein
MNNNNNNNNNAVRSSPPSRNYKTGGIGRQKGRPTNTGY